MKNFKRLLINLTFIIVMCWGFAYAKDYYGLPNDYLRYGVGSRALSMGGAFVGLADDATASYWNPAGLTQIDEFQFFSMYAPYFLDTSFNYISYVHPLGENLRLALSDVLLYSGGYETRSPGNIVEKANETVFFNTAIFSCGYRFQNIEGRLEFLNNLSLGINLKFVQENVVGHSGNSQGIDIAMLYHLISPLSIGIAVDNILQPKVKLIAKENEYKTNIKAGFSINALNRRLLFNLDINKLMDENLYFATGIECTLWNQLSIRVGLNHLQNFTFGLGFKNKKFIPLGIDYSYNVHELGELHKFGITLHWGNIYKSKLKPISNKHNRAFALQGLRNKIMFKTNTPPFKVKKWEIKIFDQENQLTKTLKGETTPPSVVYWDVCDNNGSPIKPGQYNYCFTIVYKNDKIWKDMGTINIEFPHHEIKEKEEIDIKINGNTKEE